MKSLTLSQLQILEQRLKDNLSLNSATTCWDFVGSLDSKGYGRIKFKGKYFKAHRIAYQVFVGESPECFFVCHHCDRPSCCNPEHLFLGGHKENVADKVSKNRQTKGESNGASKLKESDIRKIFQLRSAGSSYQDIASIIGCSKVLVGRIINRKNWRSVAIDETLILPEKETIVKRSRARGEQNGFAKLTESDVQTIFNLREDGLSYSAIAKIVGCSKNTIGRILNRVGWTYLTPSSQT